MERINKGKVVIRRSNCLNCDKPIEITAFGNNRKYCSAECSHIYNRISCTRDSFIIFERDIFCCFYCGNSPMKDPSVNLVVEHILPRSKGGKDKAENLLTSCQLCNGSKHNKLLNDLAAKEVKKNIIKRNQERGVDGRQLIKLRADRRN